MSRLLYPATSICQHFRSGFLQNPFCFPSPSGVTAEREAHYTHSLRLRKRFVKLLLQISKSPSLKTKTLRFSIGKSMLDRRPYSGRYFNNTTFHPVLL